MNSPFLSRARRSVRRAALRGMTIVEILVASAISLIVVGGALWLLTEGMAYSWKTSAVSSNDLTHWGINNRLIVDTRIANSLCVYSDLTTTAVSTEGSDGISYYSSPKRKVGNLLVLSLSVPNRDTGGYGCRRLTGYRYVPADKALYKFDYEATAAEIADDLPASKLLLNRLSSFTLVKVAENIELPQIGTQTSGAFFWDLESDTINARSSILRFQLGDTNKHRRVRDTRLVEVSFFVRP